MTTHNDNNHVFLLLMNRKTDTSTPNIYRFDYNNNNIFTRVVLRARRRTR